MKSVKLRSGKLGKFRPGHPWIYKEQILKTAAAIPPGELVLVLGPDGKFMGRGYYNPRSEISARILTFDNEAVDKRFFDARIKTAFEKRKTLLRYTNAIRAVFSEADGLPGLIVDLYSGTAVFQILTLGMERLKPVILESIKGVLRPDYIYEKSDTAHRRIEGMKALKKWWGATGLTEIEISEGKARFIVDIENGHKTGFYLDQRKSRMAIGAFSKGKKVLDLFSYTGGFSIMAAVYGAAAVRGMDIKNEWLDLARRNAALNGVEGRAEFVEGDAFKALRNIYNSGEKFDIIIIDPPSFVKAKSTIPSASRGYKELNLTAMKALVDGGILATFSCSHHMSMGRFSSIVKSAARDARKTMTILKRCHQAEDHPIAKSIPETEYLKGYFLRINSIL